MKKLSTKMIKDIMNHWLCTPELREQINERTIDCDESEREQHWKNWCDAKQWKRVEKRKLKEDWVDYFIDDSFIDNSNILLKEIYFPIDTAGWQNKNLVIKYFNDPKLATKCILRAFVPDNDFGDDYVLEVVTTHDDTEIIGWTINQD
jgi:hypothetical protein